METKKRIFYEAPATTVVELKTEGILCLSFNAAIYATLWNDGDFQEVDY